MRGYSFKKYIALILILLSLVLPIAFFSAPSFINFSKVINEFTKRQFIQIYQENDISVSSSSVWSFFPPTAHINNLNISGYNKSDKLQEATIGKIKISLRILPLLFFHAVPTEIDIDWFSTNSQVFMDLIKNLPKQSSKFHSKVKFSNGVIHNALTNSNIDSNSSIQITKGELQFLNDGISLVASITTSNQSQPYQILVKAHGSDKLFVYKNFEASISSQSNTLKATGEIQSGSLAVDIKGEGKQLTLLMKDLFMYHKEVIPESAQDDNFELNGRIIVATDGSITCDAMTIKGEFINATTKFSSSNSVYKIDTTIENIDLVKEFSLLKMILKAMVKNQQAPIAGLTTELTMVAKKLSRYNSIASELSFHAILSDSGVKISDALIHLPGENNIVAFSGDTTKKSGTNILNIDVNIAGDDSKEALNWITGLKTSTTMPFLAKALIKISPGAIIFPKIMVFSHDGKLSAYVRSKEFNKTNYSFYDVHGKMVNFNSFDINYKEYINSLLHTNTGLVPKESNGLILLENSYKNAEEIDSLSMTLNSSSNGISIRDITLKGSKTDLMGEIYSEYDTQQTNTKIHMNFNGEKFNGKFVSRPKIMDVEHSKDLRKVNRVIWDSEPLDFSRFVKSDLDLSFKVREFSLDVDNINLKDFNINAKVHKGTAILENLSFGVSEGAIEAQGSLVSSKAESILNVVLLARSIPIQHFIEIVSGKTLHVSGTMSSNVKFSTYGKTILQMVNNASGAANFVSVGASVNDLNIDDFFSSLFLAKSESEIENLSQIGLYDGKTIFPKLTAKTKFSGGKISGVAQATTSYSSIASSFLINNQLELTGLSRFFFVPPGSTSVVQTDVNLSGYLWDPKFNFSSKELYKIVSSTQRTFPSRS